MQMRQVAEDFLYCDDQNPTIPTWFNHLLSRITFTAPDGTEYELRDELNSGQAQTITCQNNTPPSRGKDFVTADTTLAKFISDTPITDDIGYTEGGVLQHVCGDGVCYPTGYFLLRDGTRYRIEAGLVRWMRDRNGNKLDFTYDASKRVTTVTDSLRRVVTVSYDQNCVPGGSPCVGGSYCEDLISFKGFAGTNRQVRVIHRSLSNVLRSGTVQFYNQLFNLPSASGTCFNPMVVSELELPNGRNYRFLYNAYAELARVVLPTGGKFEYDYSAGLSGVYSVDGPYESGQIGKDPYPALQSPPITIDIYRRLIERRQYTDENAATYEHKIT